MRFVKGWKRQIYLVESFRRVLGEGRVCAEGGSGAIENCTALSAKGHLIAQAIGDGKQSLLWVNVCHMHSCRHILIALHEG